MSLRLRNEGDFEDLLREYFEDLDYRIKERFTLLEERLSPRISLLEHILEPLKTDVENLKKTVSDLKARILPLENESLARLLLHGSKKIGIPPEQLLKDALERYLGTFK